MNRPCTALATEAAEQRVRRDLDVIVAAVREALPADALACVALIGGFGRGEGGIVDAAGGVTAFNDYDLAVVTRHPVDRAPFRKLAQALASRLGVDFVDLGVFTAADLKRVPPTVFWYELREGHRVLFGDPAALRAVPAIDPARLPLVEATRLLVNRGMSLLWACLHLDEARRDAASLDPIRFRFTINSIHKAVLAAGDAALIRAGRYDISYRERARRLSSVPLPFEGRERDEFVAAHAAAIRFKLFPDLTPVPLPRLVGFWSAVRAWHEITLGWIEAARLGRPVGAWRHYPARLAGEAVKEGFRHPRRYLRERRAVPLLRGMSGFLLDVERSQRARLPFLLYGATPDGADRTLLRSGLTGFGDDDTAMRDRWRKASRELLAEWHP